MSAQPGGQSGETVAWIRLSDPARRTLVNELLDAELKILSEPELPADVRLGMIVVDAAHKAALGEARGYGDTALQTILISGDPVPGQADFVLPADVTDTVLRTVLKAATDFRQQVLSLQADVASRQSAVGTINHGQFVLRTLDEARNLATMLALTCPNPDLVAIGLQELLVNAVEHGNLEITAEEKQALILEGSWRDEVERRLASAEFEDRVVMVNYQRGERLIAITIQDEGAGFDHEAYVESDVPKDGYRGRGIAMARDISFSSIAYLGRGNMVEATILLEQA